MLFLDLDNFKDVNDGLGHQYGDQLLQTVAKRLVENVRSGDTVARVGGDEFVILLTQLRDPADVESFHRKLRKVFSEPVVMGERIVRVTVSIGVAITPVDGASATDLLRHADLAMYRVKQQGRNGLAFYQSDMDVPENSARSGNGDGNR